MLAGAVVVILLTALADPGAAPSLIIMSTAGVAIVAASWAIASRAREAVPRPREDVGTIIGVIITLIVIGLAILLIAFNAAHVN